MKSNLSLDKMKSIGVKNKKSFTRKIIDFLITYRYINLLALPGIAYFIIFKYLPMYGIIIAFKDYEGTGGFWGIINSNWAGLKYFDIFFKSTYFFRLLKNTLLISFYNLIFAFPAPIILALLLNELNGKHFKKTVQTISYMPHFLSWIVCSGLILQIFSPSGGPVNAFLEKIGMQSINFISDHNYFRSILVSSNIWKTVGWGSIIYLAAITSIDTEIYEAATMDGAKKWHKMFYITLPGISEIVAIMLILNVGAVLNSNFDQIFNLYTPAVYDVADVFDTYVYRLGIGDAKFSYSAAVGLFKAVVALILVVSANLGAKKLGSEGLW